MQETCFPTQRARLQELCNRYGDFKVCKMWKDENGNTRSTKHLTVMECWESEEGLRFLNEVNNRQILPVELVLDIEQPELIEVAIKILQTLQLYNAKVYSTGSRGYHIHVFSSDFIFNPDIPLLLNKTKRNQLRQYILTKHLPFADLQKASENTMIALENAPHWKTGVAKTLVK